VLGGCWGWVGRHSLHVSELKPSTPLPPFSPCCVLYSSLTAPCLTTNSNRPAHVSNATHPLRRFMRLDAAAQRALTVFPMRGDASSSFSLLGLLGRTRTPMGKRRLKVILGQGRCAIRPWRIKECACCAICGFAPVTTQILPPEVPARYACQHAHCTLTSLNSTSNRFHRLHATLSDLPRPPACLPCSSLAPASFSCFRPG
jgi:hypothetical protein